MRLNRYCWSQWSFLGCQNSDSVSASSSNFHHWPLLALLLLHLGDSAELNFAILYTYVWSLVGAVWQALLSFETKYFVVFWMIVGICSWDKNHRPWLHHSLWHIISEEWWGIVTEEIFTKSNWNYCSWTVTSWFCFHCPTTTIIIVTINCPF